MTTGLGQFTYAYNATKGLVETALIAGCVILLMNSLGTNFPNGEVANYTYFGAAQDNRLNTLSRTLGASELFFEKYTYADNGNLLTRLKRSTGVPAQTLTYSYDDADQLLNVANPKDKPNYPQTFVYDPAGNLTSSTAGNPATSRAFTYNSLNERITDAGITQQFDANGNLSNGLGFILSWDAEDRVSSITYNGTQNRVEYDYDGLGHRARIRLVQSGVKSAEYLYIWDGLRIVEKRDSIVPGFPIAIYLPQGERKFLSGTYLSYFYLRDRLGSVRGATSDTGSIIQNIDFLPYGPTAPQQPVAIDPDFGFTGHLKCPFTGLTLAPYRVIGYANWLSRDPIGEVGGTNLYGYVANNPINLWDPLGLIDIGFPGAGGNTVGNADLRDYVENRGGKTYPRTQEGQNQALEDIKKAQAEGDRCVNISGYSRGADAANQLAEKLKEAGINVDQLNLIDPVSITGQPQHHTVPDNVTNADNYYQNSGGPFYGGAANPGSNVNNHNVSGPGVNHNNVVNTALGQ